MHWLVQENVGHEEQWNEVIAQLERLKIRHSIHKVVPFSGELIPEPDLGDQKVWCYGSLSMMKTCRNNGWYPGCIPLDNYDFLFQRCVWRNHMLNHDAAIATFVDIYNDDIPLYETNFIRPTDDSKFIKGSIMSRNELLEWARVIISDGDLTGGGAEWTSKLVIAKPKTIYAEYRFWIVNGRMITCSPYKLGDQVSYAGVVPLLARNYALQRVEQMHDINTYCLDIADTPNGYKIVEINNINSSGLYRANIQKLIMAIEDAF